MIKFPRVHIAESVVNRILNVRDSVTPAPAPAVDRTPAVVPDAATQGAGIEETLATQPGIIDGLSEPGSDTAQAAGSILSGGSSLDGLINARTQPQ